MLYVYAYMAIATQKETGFQKKPQSKIALDRFFSQLKGCDGWERRCMRRQELELPENRNRATPAVLGSMIGCLLH